MAKCQSLATCLATRGVVGIASRRGSRGVRILIEDQRGATRGTVAEVFLVFLKLGLTSFGGPIAHLGYFRDELITRRRWLSDAAYAELIALCQFLPGPASSQTAVAMGLMRAGPPGAMAAAVAFTLPSALLMLVFAWEAGRIGGPVAVAAIHGLKLVAVVIVAQAVWGMARTLAPDRPRRLIAAVAALFVLGVGGAMGQVGAIVIGAVGGWALCRNLAAPASAPLSTSVSRRTGAVCLALFFGLLAGLPLWAARTGTPGLSLFDTFYRAGALVFGGGHVVLPLLRTGLVSTGLMTSEQFLAGYGAAQALPGPLFAVAAYLGTVAWGSALGGALALAAIFLPGFLILFGTLPFWGAVRGNAALRSAMAGANSAVVGILTLALYDPLWTGSVSSWRDPVMIGVALAASLTWRLAPVVILSAIVAASVGIALIG
jgi:chromate transporter